MELLLDRRGDQIHITDELIVAAVGDLGSKDTVELLLDRGGAEIRITEEILKSAASAERSIEIMEFLLDRRGHEIQITEEVLKSAASARYSEDIMKLLLDRRGHEIQITEEVVKSVYLKETMGLLLDRKGHEIQITEEVLKSAASTTYSEAIMKLLLDRRGHEIQITKDVLMSAVENEHSGDRVISVLLKRCSDQFDLASMIEDGEILQAAVGHGQKQALKLFMENFKIENESFLMKAAQFYEAAYDGPLEVIEKLLEEGFPPGYHTYFGRTPLMNAASEGNLMVTKFLLEAKEMDVNLQDVEGRTALHFAGESGDVKTIQLLLSYGAEPHCLDAKGWTPLRHAEYYKNREAVRLFEHLF